MRDDAVITHPGKPGQDEYGAPVLGVPTTTSAKCSIRPFADGKEPELIRLYSERLAGRQAWQITLPAGTAIDRTCTLRVTTSEGVVFDDLEVLEVTGGYTRALTVRAVCTQRVKAPAFP